MALGVPDERALVRLEAQLAAEQISAVAIREPDPPWNGQLMAIGVRPQLDGSWRRGALKRLQLIRSTQENAHVRPPKDPR